MCLVASECVFVLEVVVEEANLVIDLLESKLSKAVVSKIFFGVFDYF